MRLADLVIPNTGTVSNAVPLQFDRPGYSGPAWDQVVGIDKASVYGPAVLTGVISIEVSPDDEATWYDTTLNVVIDALTLVPQIHATHIRLTSTLAEGAERTFLLHAAGPDHA